MELSNLKACEQLIDIVHPVSGDNLNIKVSVIPLSDDRMLKVKRALTNRRIALERRGKTFSAEEIENNEIELLTSAVTGWVWNPEMEFHGEVPEFNIKNMKEVFKELPWFKQQILDVLNDEKSFFPN